MNNFIAGVVTFNPDIEQFKLNLSMLENQVDDILIVDNASKNYKDIVNALKDFKNIAIIKNDKNLGIAKALNQLLENAKKRKKNWLLVLDQDSVCPENLISLYSRYVDDNIGIICPTIIDKNDNYLNDNYLNDNFVGAVSEVKEAITSGSLLNIKVSEKVGGFDDKMFIDFVDFEYCIRVLKKGYKILRVNDAVLIHQLGNIKIRHFLKKKIRVTNHSPIRQYYYARNNVYIYTKHKDYVSFLITITRASKQLYKILIYESCKCEKIINIFKGIFDGLNHSKS